MYMSAQILYKISTNKKTSGQDPFVIQYLSVSELGKYISKLEKGLDGINNQMLKLALPYTIDPLSCF